MYMANIIIVKKKIYTRFATFTITEYLFLLSDNQTSQVYRTATLANSLVQFDFEELFLIEHFKVK